MNINVVTEIVKNDYCIGCGICVNVCPVNNLTIDFDKNGQYSAIDGSKCLEKCDLCLKVCPFGLGNYSKNEDEIAKISINYENQLKYENIIGYYDNLFVGHANENIRLKGSSGGIARLLLIELLEKKLVDYVIHVKNNDDPKKLFKFCVSSDPIEIENSSASAYYPVEMSEILEFIKRNDAKYAITGVPCFLKGLRSYQQINSIIKDRIKYMFGLTCGQLKSKHFIDYILLNAGIFNEEKIREINFRCKDNTKTSDNYSYNILGVKNTNNIFFNDKIASPWNNRLLTPNACNFCDDVFAELSDISFMDAWLPEYTKDWKGTSIVISRSPIISNLIQELKKENKINIENINTQKIIESQNTPINTKRQELKWRLYKTKRKKMGHPEKRVQASREGIYSADYILFNLKELIREKSFKYYPHILTSKLKYFEILVYQKLSNKIRQINQHLKRK